MRHVNGTTGPQRPRATRMNHLVTATLALAGAVAAVTALGAGPLPPYTRIGVVTDVFGEVDTHASDINILGEVVGQKRVLSPSRVEGIPRAVRWRGGFMEYLGGVETGSSEAHAINRRSEVVGDFGGRPAFWDAAGVLRMLDTKLVAGGFGMRARALNDHGEIVGGVIATSSTSAVVGWRSPTAGVILLAPTTMAGAAFASAASVNNFGIWVGRSPEGVRSDNRSSLAVISLPLPRDYGQADPRSVNDATVIAGTARSGAGVLTATVWDTRAARIFMPLAKDQTVTSSAAADVNNQNFVVGQRSVGTDERPLVWHLDFGVRPLTVPVGFERCYAAALNDVHDLVFEVVGTCYSAIRGSRATKWTVTPLRGGFTF
jgi:hypothetical protein